jgi:hypothetical protein
VGVPVVACDAVLVGGDHILEVSAVKKILGLKKSKNGKKVRI